MPKSGMYTPVIISSSQTQLSSLCDESQLWCLDNCARNFILIIALVILLLFGHQTIAVCP